MAEMLALNLNTWTPGPAQSVIPGDYLFQIKKGSKQIANDDGVRSQARWVAEIVAAMPGLESEVGKVMFHNTNTTPEWIDLTMRFLSAVLTNEEFKAVTSSKTPKLSFDTFVGKFFGGSVMDVPGKSRDGTPRTFSNITQSYSKDVFQLKYDAAQEAPVSIFTAKTSAPINFDDDPEV